MQNLLLQATQRYDSFSYWLSDQQALREDKIYEELDDYEVELAFHAKKMNESTDSQAEEILDIVT